MKKIKGGKRKGAGRKKTGRNTEVVSFSIPKDRVEEIRNLIKEKLTKTIQKEEEKVDEAINEHIEESKKETTTTNGFEQTVSIPKKSFLTLLQDAKNGKLDMKEFNAAALTPNQRNLILKKQTQ